MPTHKSVMDKTTISNNLDRIAEATRDWIETFVIGLDLCPFAKREVRRGSVRLYVSDAIEATDLLIDIENEVKRLTDDAALETSFLIHPGVLTGFTEYNDFLSVVDTLLQSLGQEGIIQVASFHPQYQFANTDAGDAENFTNKSPYPMIHFLREDSVSKAIDTHPDTASIPAQNVAKLKNIGSVELQELLTNCFPD